MLFSSCDSQGLEEIDIVRYSRNPIRFVFRFRGPRKSQRVYCTVKIGCLCEEIKIFEFAFSAKTYEKGGLPSPFLKIKAKQECKKINAAMRLSLLDSWWNMAKVSQT